MRTVVSIHGISTQGKWQDDLEPLFKAAQFHYVPIRYRSYRWLGVLKLVLEPWVLFPGTLAVAWARYQELLSSWVMTLAAAAVMLVVAHLASYVRRWATLKKVRRDLTQHMLFGRRPHVIAHSFGTYLTCTTLRTYPDSRTSHLILTGCVISRGWDWKGLHARNQSAFRYVRNEVAQKDWVARAAYFLEGLIPGFGMAGFGGFRESNLVHNVGSSNVACRSCGPPPVTALAHNVLSPECGHSDAFIGWGYAATFWLPFLWDIEPWEYQRLCELCVDACEWENIGTTTELAIVEQELRAGPWRWAGGALDAHVRKLVTAHPRLAAGAPVDGLVHLCVRQFWQAMGAASTIVYERAPGWETRVKSLRPQVAVAMAIEAVLP